MQVQHPAGIAARAGLITGMFIGVLSLPVITISGVTHLLGLRLIFLAIAFVAFAVAGYLATRRSGLIRSGVGAGALAATVAVFIAVCCGVVIVALLAPAITPGVVAFGGRPRRGALAVALLLRLVLQTLFILCAGVLGGALGALLGRLGWQRGRAAPGVAPATGVYTPGGAVYPPPQPFSPPAAPYDSDAPTTITPSGPRG